MAVPDFQSMMLPILQIVADGESHKAADINATLAAKLDLSESDLAELLPSGRQATFINRSAWAKAYLFKAGLLSRPQRGFYEITGRGREALAADLDRVTLKYLKQFPEFRTFNKGSGGSVETTDDDGDSSEGAQTPLELVENGCRLIKAELAEELLEQVMKCPPAFFEKLVVELLVAMGYGGSIADAGEAVGRSGDDGIDGIIKEDRLGLDAVYIQAKRREGVVGRPIVQAFAGSLEGQRARKGVFITTSRFSKDAREYVGRIGKSIVLIDGLALAELMIDFGVGVTEVALYSVKRLDADYFDGGDAST